jgi:16S rRNA (adenine1518-N6/adenine1519-N6)-dimethyltransferase
VSRKAPPSAAPGGRPAGRPTLHVSPKKSLGQNFLVDPAHRARIVAAAELSPGDAVLEIGPGRGELTELIAAQAAKVVAVELDDRLIEPLGQRFASMPGVTIVHGDILDLDPGPLMRSHGAETYKVVANLPYYITGAAIRRLLETEPAAERIVITVQAEVAERMVAAPPEMSLLAVSVQFYCDAHIAARIPAGAFYPIPKVDSAVVVMQRRLAPVEPAPGQPPVSAEAFFRVAKAGFSQPRKQIHNTLAAGLRAPGEKVAAWLALAGIDPKRRAGALAVEEWARLAGAVGSDTGEA